MDILINPARLRSRGPFLDPPMLLRPNIMVGPGIYLTPAFVNQHKITHVVNVADDSAAPMWVKRSFGHRYAHIPTEDNLTTNIFDAYPKFEQTMLQFLRDPSSRMIYVHCQAGMNRSATLAIAFVSRIFQIPVEGLIFHGLRQRPCILANPSFNAQLLAFAKKNATR
jgi:protein-tyrosine phosphatase